MKLTNKQMDIMKKLYDWIGDDSCLGFWLTGDNKRIAKCLIKKGLVKDIGYKRTDNDCHDFKSEEIYRRCYRLTNRGVKLMEDNRRLK